MNIIILFIMTALFGFGAMRSHILNECDAVLGLILPEIQYELKKPVRQRQFYSPGVEFRRFAKNYGYFSNKHPILGKVTESQEDIDLTIRMLKAVHRKIDDPFERMVATSELLTKVLAYRELKVGQKIPIPTADENNNPILNWYTVDTVFDLWRGMPAFGLVSPEKNSILLFRGTDLSLSMKGFASILSDIDLNGVGYKTFYHCQDQLHDWLSQQEKKSVVMGYSLGGTLVYYTLIYEGDHIESAVAFNPAGVSRPVLEDWFEIPEEERPSFLVFVNQGDPVSKKGLLFGQIYEFGLYPKRYPWASHLTFISGEYRYRLFPVDVNRENSKRYSLE